MRRRVCIAAAFQFVVGCSGHQSAVALCAVVAKLYEHQIKRGRTILMLVFGLWEVRTIRNMSEARYSGIHLSTNQYLIYQQLFSFMASLGAGKLG